MPTRDRAIGLVATIAAAALFLSGAGASRGKLSCFTTHALEKVRPGDPLRPRAPVELRAARNEFEPFQVVLRAADHAVAGIDVTVTDLVGEGGTDQVGSSRIPADRATVYLERYLTLSVPSSIEGGSGEWPDPLVPRTDRYRGERRNAFPFTLPPGRNQPLWIEIYVPRDAAPGRYRGHVEVTVAGKHERSIPFGLTVLPFELPSTSTLPTSFGFSAVSALHQHRGSYTSDAELYELTRLYGIAALRHRLSLHGGSGVPPRFDAGSATDDLLWTGYDAEVAPFLDGTIFGESDPLPGARATSIDLRAIPELPDAERVACYRAWARHFRTRGWLDRLFLYLWDEPVPADYPEVRRIAALARQADPAIRTLVTEQLADGLAGAVDVWTPLVNCVERRPELEATCDEAVPRDAYRQVERRGAEVWWYQSCASHGCQGTGGEPYTGWPSYAIDATPVAHRIMPWLTFGLGFAGELYYNTVEAYGSGADPWTRNHVHGGNGDGTLFYPGTPRRIGGETHVPVESIRLKLIREGLEDYEYLVLLARTAGEDRAHTLARNLAPTPFRFSRDAASLFRARDAAAREIAAAPASRGRAR